MNSATIEPRQDDIAAATDLYRPPTDADIEEAIRNETDDVFFGELVPMAQKFRELLSRRW